MIDKYFEGSIPDNRQQGDFDEDLRNTVMNVPLKVEQLLDKLQFSAALTEIWKAVSRTNKYIDETMPWVLAKDDSNKPRLAEVMYNLAESLRIISVLIQPFMPRTPEKIWHQLGITDNSLVSWNSTKTWGVYPKGLKVNKGEVIFPRIDVKKEMEELEKLTLKPEDEKRDTKAENKGENSEKKDDAYISIEDFAKLDLRVAKVLAAEKVEGADKLLKLKLEVGSETRQVVSGIAKHYTPDEITGKYVILVANLKPVKLRGIDSQGMILAASNDKELVLATVDKIIDSGAKVK